MANMTSELIPVPSLLNLNLIDLFYEIVGGHIKSLLHNLLYQNIVVSEYETIEVSPFIENGLSIEIFIIRPSSRRICLSKSNPEVSADFWFIASGTLAPNGI